MGAKSIWTNARHFNDFGSVHGAFLRKLAAKAGRFAPFVLQVLATLKEHHFGREHE